MIHYALGPRFLAAVFDTEAALDGWLASVPHERRASLRTGRDERDLPTFLVESNGFVWCDGSELGERLLAWSDPAKPDDWVLGNVFFLAEPWSPPRPGTDYMGVLPHVHVHQEDVERLRREGVDAFLESWLSPTSLARLRSRAGR
ncbi:MAG: hypothetical protein H6722_04230 [Sandaracinus sp.]|nr:hypothetical protein [Sandaracinus sp.]